MYLLQTTYIYTSALIGAAVAAGVFRLFPSIFSCKKISSVFICEKFGEYVSIRFDNSKSMRIPAIIVPTNCKNIRAIGTTVCGEEELHLERLGNIIIGLPCRPSDVGYKQIVIYYNVDGEDNMSKFDHLDKIKLTTIKMKKYVNIEEDDFSEDEL